MDASSSAARRSCGSKGRSASRERGARAFRERSGRAGGGRSARIASRATAEHASAIGAPIDSEPVAAYRGVSDRLNPTRSPMVGTITSGGFADQSTTIDLGGHGGHREGADGAAALREQRRLELKLDGPTVGEDVDVRHDFACAVSSPDTRFLGRAGFGRGARSGPVWRRDEALPYVWAPTRAPRWLLVQSEVDARFAHGPLGRAPGSIAGLTLA